MIRKKRVTVKQIQKLDADAIDRYGVPSIALMENAGRSVAQEALKLLKRKRQRRVLILCGLGNNAGDGFVVARHLVNNGLKPNIYLIGHAANLKADALTNYKILKNVRYPVASLKAPTKKFLGDLKRSDLVVDAVFGVGLSRDIGEPFKSFIDQVNEAKASVLAVDIPSGLDGTTGKIYGVCIKAKVTVSFSFPKQGFVRGFGKKQCGRVVIIDIGIPRRLMDRI